MVLRVRLLILVVVLFLGCSGRPEPTVEVDHGAGTVLRVDQRLDAIVPEDYRIEKLAGDMGFVEGPVWIRTGQYLLFSDIPQNTVRKWSASEGLTDFLRPVFEENPEGVGSNGLTLDSQGNLILCEHGNRRISRLQISNPEEREVIVDRFEGKRLNSPNDLIYRSDGSLFFTDPPYGLRGQDEDPEKELDFNGIYRLSPDEKSLVLLYSELERPNGIGLSPDEKTLYVANSFPKRKIWMAFEVAADETLTNPSVFFDTTEETAPGLPDGLKLDRVGNLFCTGPGGVWIFTPGGDHLGTIQPNEIPANVGWGDDGKTLYMTARTGLYRIRLQTEGSIP